MLKISSSGFFARPADTTAYASGDLVGNSVTAGSVLFPTLGVHPTRGGIGKIRKVRLEKNGAVLTNAAFRVHFYTAQPTPTNGDNGAWLTTRAGWLGSVDVTIDKAFANGSSGIGALAGGAEIAFDLAADQTRLFAAVEARGAYTPASGEQFNVVAEIDYEG